MQGAPVIDYLEALKHAKANKILANSLKNLRGLDFDAIAFTGVSGALVAPALAYNLGKGLIVVRRGPRHSGWALEGHINASTYIIVDDFLCSGNTVKRIARAVQKGTAYSKAEKPRLVGVYEYLYAMRTNGYLHTPNKLGFRNNIPMRDLISGLFDKYGH